MTVFFVNDTVLPNDPDGFGNWSFAHYQEHRQFVQIASAHPGLVPPDLDISVVRLNDPTLLAEWLGTHAAIHNVLRQITSASGVDLATVDFTDDGQWFQWMDAHAAEHRQIRAAFGITS